MSHLIVQQPLTISCAPSKGECTGQRAKSAGDGHHGLANAINRAPCLWLENAQCVRNATKTLSQKKKNYNKQQSMDNKQHSIRQAELTTEELPTSTMALVRALTLMGCTRNVYILFIFLLLRSFLKNLP